jgi:hypothetical protein
MNSVALLDRVESKYLLNVSMLLDALAALREEYAVLEIDGRRINRYRTLYFDTEDFALYHRHQAGALNRYKVRAREYVESQLAFLEVKHKTNKQRIVKSRVATASLVTEMDEGMADFVDGLCPYAAATLAPRLWNRYNRVTLVNLRNQERLTIDLGLVFEWAGEQVRLPGLVIVEAKLPARRSRSPFVTWAAANHLRATGFSKYCIGTSLLYPTVKSNHFRKTHRHVSHLLQGENYGTH